MFCRPFGLILKVFVIELLLLLCSSLFESLIYKKETKGSLILLFQRKVRFSERLNRLSPSTNQHACDAKHNCKENDE
jgi:hypothetical protein